MRDGPDAEATLRTGDHALVLLDLGLPHADGLALLRTTRTAGIDTPVLIITARNALDDRTGGLDLGADDYLVKPFETRELLARMRAVLRRRAGRATARLLAADTAIFASAIVALLAAKIRVNRFHTALYWAVITATTLAGTTLADFGDRSFGIGYADGSLILLSSVVLTLLLWNCTLGTVAIATVRTPRAEGFYWATIMFSQTLGTALGDWMADSTGLGYS